MGCPPGILPGGYHPDRATEFRVWRSTGRARLAGGFMGNPLGEVIRDNMVINAPASIYQFERIMPAARRTDNSFIAPSVGQLISGGLIQSLFACFAP